MSRRPDAIVVGAGIVGVACARALARDGAQVLVVDRQPPAGGATAAGMGHLVVLDDSPAQLRLTRYSLALWEELASSIPAGGEWSETGTLWLAATEAELRASRTRAGALAAAGITCEMLDARALREAEPNVAPDLLGALRVPGDRVIYPPTVTGWLLERACEDGARFERVAGVEHIGPGHVRCTDGRALEADLVIDAAGTAAVRLLGSLAPPERIRARKGHLLITDANAPRCRHQLIESGYLASAHGSDEASVAFNLQPRTTGQLLLGSSRAFDAPDDRVEWAVVVRMVERARRFFPAIDDAQIVRTWTGSRAATADGLPLIGPVDDARKVWLAAGHEGLGITTSLATAALLADAISGREAAIDPSPYLPGRTRRARASA